MNGKYIRCHRNARAHSRPEQGGRCASTARRILGWRCTRSGLVLGRVVIVVVDEKTAELFVIHLFLGILILCFGRSVGVIEGDKRLEFTVQVAWLPVGKNERNRIVTGRG